MITINQYLTRPVFNHFTLKAIFICVLVALFSPIQLWAAEIVTYYHLDALGSPVAATDEQGNLKWREDYKPYGEKIRNEAAAATSARAYTGHVHDNDTGLTYMGARFYDPVVGRFMAVDPVAFTETNPHSFNPYGYANSNPYKFVDPDGRAPIFVPIIVAIIGEGANLYLEANSPPPPGCGNDCVVSSGAGIPGPIGWSLAKTTLKTTGRETAEIGTESVQRAMSREELKATVETGLLRGGREGTHFASDAVNSSANRARQRLALPKTPDVRATLEVPSGAFSKPSRVKPDFGMPGGGTERTATGHVPARVIRVDELR